MEEINEWEEELISELINILKKGNYCEEYSARILFRVLNVIEKGE